MGMFDWIEFNGEKYQSKDTPRQMCDEYAIDLFGRLMVEEYDAEWVEDEGHVFGAYIDQRNKRWRECVEFSGQIRFYREDKERGGWEEDAWIEWLAEFKSGQMIDLKRIENDHFLDWYRTGIEKRGLE